MMILLATSVIAICCAGLLAWRWYLEQRRWECTNKNAARDAVLESLEPRMYALEKKLNDATWANSIKSR